MAASQLSRLERGERSCTAEVGRRLASYYGVAPELIELAEGRVPADILEILREHPEEMDRLRRTHTLAGRGVSGREGP
jgi:hypothetical protein